ncbi:hypothetical protein TthTMY_08820 [Thermus thermophilus]|nr:hypothetical protein TthTMY_08820 [Thermus thermophilus]
MKFWMRAILVLLVLLPGLAQAQVVTPFAKRFEANERGEIRMVGNTLMCAQGSGTYGCNTTTMNNPNANNNTNMVFLNADPANPTWPTGRGGSSAAQLSLPPGAQVLWAGLYWGARAGQSASGRNTIYLKPPGATAYQAITGSLLGTITTQGTSTSRPYVAFADVTGLVASAGSGTYWVGGILAQTGNDGLGYYAGWSLVVVYRDPSATFKNLVVYDGLASVSSGNNVLITLSGFLTPLVGPVNARVGAVAYEGDGGITGDQLLLNGSALSDAQNPVNNFFNSSISDLGSRFTNKTPDFVNQMAVDVDLVDATGRIPNGATSATVQFTSSQDVYFPAVMAFAVDLYLPDLVTTFTKTVSDLNGGDLRVGDLLEYAVSFTNTGLDGATNVVVVDPIPAGTQYVPGSLRVVQNALGAPTGTFTDAPGDDIAEYSPSCPEAGGGPCVRFRLGTGANASQGGLIPPGQGAEVRFRVQVLPEAAGSTLVNTARVNYNAQTLGTSYSKEATVSASVTVVGFTLAGQVYHDLEPNGLKSPGESWSDGATVWVKLLQGGSVVAQVQVDPGSGVFSFTGVAPGSYTLFLDDNNNLSDTTPTPPSGWLFVNPPSGSLSLNVSQNLSGLDFGLFHGARLVGTVFYDDGEGGGAANDAWQTGGERGVPGVAVTAQGSAARSATTDGQGRYVLYVPWNFGSFTLSHPLRPATGWNDGSTAHKVPSWAGAQNPAFPTLDAAAIAGTEVARNFGVVRESRFYPPQTGQTASPGVVVYPHLYRPGTLGSLTLSLANAPSWPVQVRVDGNCDGDFDDPGEGFASLPQTLPVGPSWPREADGSLKACALEARVLVPPGVPAGAVDVALLQGALAWANNPGVVDLRSLADTTTVSGGEVRLEKKVRNVTQGTGFGTVGEGRPGEVLEYCVAYRNLGTAPVSQFLLTDPIPFFTDPLPSVPDYGGKAIRWSHGSATLYLTASPADDAGEISGGVVRVEVGNVGPGEAGEVCYRAQIR